MLTLEQSQEYNRFKRLFGFLTANSTITSTFAPFQTEVASYTINLQSLDALVPNKNAITSGITSEKSALKQTIADNIALVCKKTKSYALIYNLPQLAAGANVRSTKILRMKDSDILGFALQIQSLITPELAVPGFVPYNITATTLATIVTNATAFNSMIGKADTTAAVSTTANTSINNLIKELHTNITHFDLLVDEFESSNPAFVQGYHINSSLDSTGVHHSGIEGAVTVKATTQPVANATITISATGKADKIFTTDINGAYHADRISAGDYAVTVSATGFTSQTITHHVLRGKIDEIDFTI